MSEEESFDRVVQNRTDQTAPIVYEAGKRALEADNSLYNAALVHEEDLHINLGRGLETISGIDDDIQFRRPGGGGYIIHDGFDEEGTYCFIDARVKNGPKEGFSREREMMAQRTLEALETVYDTGIRDGNFLLTTDREDIIEDPQETAYYNPNEGDIYLQKGPMPRYDDPQIAGIGLAELEIDNEWVQIGRVCMYPEGASDTAVELDREIREKLDLEEPRLLKERVESPDEFRKVQAALEKEEHEAINAEEFLCPESIERGRELQERNGYRPADPCF